MTGLLAVLIDLNFKTRKELDKYSRNEGIHHQGFVAEIEHLDKVELKKFIQNKSNSTLVCLDEITDPSFQAKSQGIIVDLEAYKGIIKALTESIIIGPFRVIYEADEFLCVHRYSKFRNAEIFDASITAVSYKDQKIISQESRREELDYDPSEGQDWNWEDYE